MENYSLIIPFTPPYLEYCHVEEKLRLKYENSFCSYALPPQPGPNRTGLCGLCIPAIAGD